MKTAKFFLSLFLVCAAVSTNAAELLNRVLATVDDQVITLKEAQERLSLIIAAGNLPPEAAQDPRMRENAVRSLVDERIKQTAAQKASIQVSEPDVAQGFAQLAQQNNFTPAQFSELLAQQGVSMDSLNQQLKADLMWRRYVEARLVPQMKIDPAEIKQQMAQLKAHIGKTEYNIAEIFLPVDQNGDEKAVQQQASDIYNQLGHGGSFPALARSFSAGSAAAQGGLLGWVQPEQLAPEVAKAVAEMTINQLTAPIRSARGYHIILLRQTRTIAAENLPTEDQLNNTIANQRIDVLQRRALRDLRLAATIEMHT